MQTTGRVYGGRSEAERRADRRRRLLDAGLELFGTEGWSGTSIERLCAAAGVATRSFYEEYAAREQLLLAVYDEVLAGAAAAVVDAVTAAGDDDRARTHAGVAAYVGHLTEDPRRAQVVNREVRSAGSLPDVVEHRRAAMTRFVQLVSTEARRRGPEQDEQERRVLSLALTGAVNEVLSDWVSTPPPRPSTEPLVRALSHLYLSALRGADA